MILGAQIPLGLLAAQGLTYGLALPLGRSALARSLAASRRYSRRGMRRLLVTAVIGLTLPTPLFLLAGSARTVWAREPPIYHPRAEVAALDWLAAHSTLSDTVLSAYATGNYVPARAGNRVVLGLGPQTVDLAAKRAEVRRFYRAGTPDAWRQDLLTRYGVAYVWAGPHERTLGDPDLAGTPFLRLVYDREGYAIYEVLCE
jgi:hypothetical protein